MAGTMKTSFGHVALALAVFCGVGIQRVEGQVAQTALVTGTELAQTATVNNGVNTKTKSPTVATITPRVLENDLAVAETQNQSWFAGESNYFPGSAKLVARFPGVGDFSSVSFSVVWGTNVVDVSNILSAAPSDPTVVVASVYTDAAGANQPPFTDETYEQYSIAYDTRPTGGVAHYVVTGMAVSSMVTTKPNAKGIYSETDQFIFVDGTGSGVDEHTNTIVLSGVTLSARGTAKVNVNGGAAGAAN
jgi:hypothetical protein